MNSANPRVSVAVAYARSLASAQIKGIQGGGVFLQQGTKLTDEEIEVVEQELDRIRLSIEESINPEMLAMATD